MSGSSASIILYRLPKTTEVVALRGSFTRLDYTEIDLAQLNGFVLNSFDNRDCFLMSDFQKENIPQETISTIDADFHRKASENLEIIQTQYLKELDGFKVEMQETGIQKAIFSRIKKHDGSIDPMASYEKMCLTYPDAFCYLISSPETGTWMGATPEKLFNELPNGSFQIHALAGTQPANAIHWSEKEYEEQQLVTDYIVEKLKNSGIDQFSLGQRETVNAGKLAHLCTTITLAPQSGGIDPLIRLLHPTPAVCGTPTELAKQLITRTEKHQRKFYTGFLGPLGDQLGRHLFVNLRCMELTQTGADLYLGGGITQKSIPESEWNETELKAQTMLNIITS